MGHHLSEEVTVAAEQGQKEQPENVPKKAVSAHLIVLSGANVGQVFALDRKAVLIGREEGADIQILDAGISRRHALVSRGGQGSYFVEDAGSRNGTFANNQRVERQQELHDGDKIQIGVMTILKFTYDDPETTYAQTMYEAALRDGLTGVFNRRYFEDRLRAEFSFASRHQSALALLVLDLDHFKTINDKLGHLAGDSILKQFAKLVSRSTRAEDVLCRYGGEEFAVLCRETELMKSSVLAERIRHEVSVHSFAAEGRPLQLTVSIGIAAIPDETIKTPEELVLSADEALYQAKERGRNCVVTRHRKI